VVEDELEDVLALAERQQPGFQQRPVLE